jgi:chromosome segregation ATPase
MPRPPVITYEDVARACVRLIGRAKHPSADALYEELGRKGSKSTIHKHQKEFLKKFQEKGVAMLPSALPETLLPAIEEFWSEALLMAGKNYAKHEEEWARRLQEMEEKLEQHQETIDKQASALEKSRRELEEVHKEKVAADEHAADLKSQLRTANSLVESLRSDKERLYEQIDRERKDSQARFDRAKEDHQAERETLKEALESLKEQRREDNEKQERLTDYWAIQVDDARNTTASIRQELVAEKKAHTRDLNIERTKIGELSNQLERIRDELQAAQRDQVTLSREKAEISESFHEATLQVKQLTARLQAVEDQKNDKPS